MKIKKFFLIAAIVVLSAACKKDDEPNKMTMVTNQSNVTIRLIGTGTVTIDWGDKTEKEIHSLWGYEVGWNTFQHSYMDGISDHVITITGDNITHLDCERNALSSLDVSEISTIQYLNCAVNYSLSSLNVSKNSMLTHLICHYNALKVLDVSKNTKLVELSVGANQLTELTVSNNTVLENLRCGGNQLTSLELHTNTELTLLACHGMTIASLDLSKNHKLTSLQCGGLWTDPAVLGNRLTSLDLSGCISLSYLNCETNLLSADALNALFESLNNSAISGKEILISRNPGTNDCKWSIAENKGWLVTNRSL